MPGASSSVLAPTSFKNILESFLLLQVNRFPVKGFPRLLAPFVAMPLAPFVAI